MNHIKNATLLVLNYDDTIAFYTQKLNFILVEDVQLGDGKRWVTIQAKDQPNFALVVTLANTDLQKATVGKQAGDGVAFFMQTNDSNRDYVTFSKNGVQFLQKPTKQPYGTVAIFKDLYGNKWDLIEPAK
ncbi:VOC family protein [Cellulophaga omnivescoria]|uniref:VOC family protein n=1 Tax=Cellulophaga omnivescoria TaxID=1888890 RepID=UPI0009851F04|nr:VOC family protein [Cellulophaga omnivescoria]WBU90773.1 VOC family protein [Cellulophaga omnivescoria]WKB82905.1 VOC family protein [Cellulophaga lytica]